jgi:hypothetical protein
MIGVFGVGVNILFFEYENIFLPDLRKQYIVDGLPITPDK